MKISMMYDAVFRVEVNPMDKMKAEADLVATYETASNVGSHIIRVTAQHMARNAKSVGKTTTLRQSVKVINVTSVPVYISQRKEKVKRFHEINEEKSESMDDLADQVQSLFYSNVQFNSVNNRRHTEIECNTPNEKVSRETFKVDTEADRNLMPISMFM